MTNKTMPVVLVVLGSVLAMESPLYAAKETAHVLSCKVQVDFDSKKDEPLSIISELVTPFAQQSAFGSVYRMVGKYRRQASTEAYLNVDVKEGVLTPRGIATGFPQYPDRGKTLEFRKSASGWQAAFSLDTLESGPVSGSVICEPKELPFAFAVVEAKTNPDLKSTTTALIPDQYPSSKYYTLDHYMAFATYCTMGDVDAAFDSLKNAPDTVKFVKKDQLKLAKDSGVISYAIDDHECEYGEDSAGEPICTKVTVTPNGIPVTIEKCATP